MVMEICLKFIAKWCGENLDLQNKSRVINCKYLVYEIPGVSLNGVNVCVCVCGYFRSALNSPSLTQDRPDGGGDADVVSVLFLILSRTIR